MCPQTEIKQRPVNNTWRRKNCCNKTLTFFPWLHYNWQNTHLSFLPTSSLHFLPFLYDSSGHCYYQTIVTPVSLPDSPCSRIPHTVTLVSIPASAEGNNGRRGRGFSVAIDQPLSPNNGYSPENGHTGHTVRVSQWVHVCVFVCIFCGCCIRKMRVSEDRLVRWRTKDKGLKMEDRVIYEIHLKCIMEWKEMSRNLSHCYLNETLSALSSWWKRFIVYRKVCAAFFIFFFLPVLHLHPGLMQTALVQMWKIPFMLEIGSWKSMGRPFTMFL